MSDDMTDQPHAIPPLPAFDAEAVARRMSALDASRQTKDGRRYEAGFELGARRAIERGTWDEVELFRTVNSELEFRIPRTHSLHEYARAWGWSWPYGGVDPVSLSDEYIEGIRDGARAVRDQVYDHL